MVMQGPGFVEMGGLSGLAALLVGVVVLAFGIAVAWQCGPRRHALALFAAAWLPLPIGLLGKTLGEIAALQEVVMLGPAVTPKDLAGGMQYASGASACALVAMLLGLSGSVAALARSREEGPPAA